MSSERAVYVVTGSAAGIGAACVRRLAAAGAAVVVNYTTSEAEARAVATACADAGGEALLVRADVSDDAACRSMADAALARWGRIDGLVNNAGTTVFASHRDLDALDAAAFQRLYAVNVVGTYQMTRAVVPALRARHGAVVNVSSMAGLTGEGSSIAYAASKGALNTLTLSLARALAPEIRVNAVCPGLVETRWTAAALGPEAAARRVAAWEAAAPLGRILTPDDVADAVCWLLLRAPATTGEILQVDGGFHLGPAMRAR
ncbi:MAG TPA: glucose 1-dehydrogenase [Candidatus Sulfotelmatobacter sp.]|nr:glucose 1-dehydrogenase [Candidatus Sulfotelmatobacter sp.]